MKLTITTTPEEDSYLQAQSDAAMVGQGKTPQPPLDQFTDAFLHAYLAQGVQSQVASKRESIKADIATADAATLDAIKAAVIAAKQPPK